MKELLEAYVLEAVELRNQAELLSRLVSVMHEDLTDEDGDGYMPISIDELQKVTVLDIKIDEGVVHIG